MSTVFGRYFDVLKRLIAQCSPNSFTNTRAGPEEKLELKVVSEIGG